MKKTLAVLFLFVGFTCFSQETPNTTTTTFTTSTTTVVKPEKPNYNGKKDEFKIDPTYLVFGAAFNASYERVLSAESGLGVTLILSSGSEIQTTFSLTPYYRFYFGRKTAAGFFFEGFGAVNSFKYEKNSYYTGFYSYPKEIKSTTDLAVGFGIGGKWITNNGFIFELSSGIGRNLLNDYSTKNTNGLNSSDKIYWRGGLSIGYRF